MPSVSEYHQYGMAEILTWFESDSAWMGMLGRRVTPRRLPPTCVLELRRELFVEWSNLSQDQMYNLIQLA